MSGSAGGTGEAVAGILDTHAINRMLPHRYPFLLVDRARDLCIGESIVGIKNVTANEPFFQGHFPGRPIMPGVLVVEAMAQTSALLVGHTLDLSAENADIYFMSVERAKFRRPIEPGDQVELHVRALNARQRVWRFAGTAIVSGKRVAEAEFTVMYAPKRS